MNIFKLNQDLLVSYSKNQGLFFQKITEPYDVTLVLRGEYDLDNKQIIYNSKEVGEFLMEGLDKIIIKKWTASIELNPNVKSLNVSWSQESENGIEEMLTFFGPDTYLSYYGEYGTELVCFLPFIWYLYNNNQMKNRKISTYKGMSIYYKFLNNSAIHEKDIIRDYFMPNFRFPTPNLSEHGARKSQHEKYRDLRTEYYSLKWSEIAEKKPIMFIQNKFTVEWVEGPVNYLPIIFLEYLFKEYSEKYEIIYSRPGLRISKDYSIDLNDFCNYPDEKIADKYSIKILEKIEGEEYNKLKLEILSASRIFISVQGGGSYVLPSFKDSDIFILHKRGEESSSGAYEENGFFSYMNDGKSNIYISKDHNELWNNINLRIIK